MQVKERALELSKAMENEDGVAGAVQAFHRHFPRESLKSEAEKSRQPSNSFSLRRCFRCSWFLNIMRHNFVFINAITILFWEKDFRSLWFPPYCRRLR